MLLALRRVEPRATCRSIGRTGNARCTTQSCDNTRGRDLANELIVRVRNEQRARGAHRETNRIEDCEQKLKRNLPDLNAGREWYSGDQTSNGGLISR